MAKNTKLWGGRFEGTVEDWVERFGASISFDQKLAKFDLIGSLAHVQMLGQTGILSLEESEKIQAGLKELLEELEAGQLDFDIANEDIHMNMEVLLTEKIGPLAGKLHTARSRNDQVATDMHLYLKEQLGHVLDKLAHLKGVLLDLAENHVETIMPGYTHLQIAMPSSFGLWFAAYAESLADDLLLMQAAYKICNRNPLGSAAGYGSPFPLNRSMTTELLGFDSMNYNVVYAQMGRGKMERTVAYAMAGIAATLSKLAMDACLFNSQYFGFIQ